MLIIKKLRENNKGQPREYSIEDKDNMKNSNLLTLVFSPSTTKLKETDTYPALFVLLSALSLLLLLVLPVKATIKSDQCHEQMSRRTLGCCHLLLLLNLNGLLLVPLVPQCCLLDFPVFPLFVQVLALFICFAPLLQATSLLLFLGDKMKRQTEVCYGRDNTCQMNIKSKLDHNNMLQNAIHSVSEVKTRRSNSMPTSACAQNVSLLVFLISDIAFVFWYTDPCDKDTSREFIGQQNKIGAKRIVMHPECFTITQSLAEHQILELRSLVNAGYKCDEIQ